jgi:hypothetical protein
MFCRTKSSELGSQLARPPANRAPEKHPQGAWHMIHLAHLSQVDCQFGSHPKPFQNNDLQFGCCLVQAHLAHCAHTQAKKIVEKCANCSHQSAMQFGKMGMGECCEFVSFAQVWWDRSGCATR